MIKRAFVVFRQILFNILPVLFFFFYIQRFSFYITDDAFIHFRIARNIVESGLPYFNVDEMVMGSSPHLWINLSACYIKIFGNDLSKFYFISWFFTSLSFFVLTAILRTKFSAAISFFCSLLIISLFLLPSAAGLMETPLVIFLMLLAVLLLQRGIHFWFGFVSLLAFCVRIEMVFLGPLALIFSQSNQERKKIVYGSALPFAVYLTYTLYFFGTLIPFPLIAKPKVYPVDLLHFFYSLPPASSYPNTFIAKSLLPEVKATMVGVGLLFLIIFLLFEFFRKKMSTAEKIILILPILILGGYFFSSVFVFSWYAPLFSILFATSFLLFLEKRIPQFVLIACGLFNPIFIGTVGALAFFTKIDYLYDDFGPGWRVQRYLQVGEELYKDNPKGTLLTSEIGALGWVFKGKLFDGAALITPSALKYHPMAVPQDRPTSSAGSIPYQTVFDFNPDFIVSLPIFSVAVRREIKSGKIQNYLPMRYMPIFPSWAPPEWPERVWKVKFVEILKKKDP